MENEGNNTDVNNVDTTTTDDSSNVDQTTTTTDDTNTADDTNSDGSTGDDTMADGSKRSDKTVPYDVFAENNAKRDAKIQELEDKIARFESQGDKNQNVDPVLEGKKEEAKKALKDLLGEMGYVSKEDLQRQKADENLERELGRLEKQYDGKADPALKFVRKEVIDYALQNGIGNPEMAFKLLKEKELTNEEFEFVRFTVLLA